ncbi:MAG: biopolymer transporter ExbD [Candidatus Babeliaceae bacterium]|nr:biopolymer transporter ExbD [Candidatus Babeliaceae bacterium]
MRRRRLFTIPGEEPQITLTPLIDTVLVLLITFMIAMPVMHNILNIELPSSSSDDAQGDKLQGVTVFLDRDRHLWVNEKEIARADLTPEVERILGAARDQVVIVKADRLVPYGEVAGIVDDIKYLGGVHYVALATEHA